MIWLVSSALAVTPQQLTNSMGMDQSHISTQSYSGDANAAGIETAMGVISPTEGSDFTHLFTGIIGVAPEPGEDLGSYGPTGDETTLNVSMMVPTGKNSLMFDFYFLSAEYPEFVGQVYNDTFEANITGSAWSGNAAIDSMGNVVGVNSAFFSVVSQADLSGSGYDNGIGGGTGWLTMIVPVTPGDTVQLEFSVYDVYDGIYDSAVLLDNFQWSETEVEEPSIIVPVYIDYLSPKRGDVDGGETTVISGENFDSSCVAYFDGIQAVSSTLLSSNQLSVITPPHEEGLVDIDVECAGAQDILSGGYTYYLEGELDDPPRVESIDPYRVYITGGEEVTIYGSAFQDGAIVYVDGADVVSTYSDGSTMSFTTPEHIEGLASVTVMNPDGLADERAGALLFVAPAAGEEVPESNNDTEEGSDLEEEEGKVEGPSGCAAAPLIPILLLPLFGWRRER